MCIFLLLLLLLSKSLCAEIIIGFEENMVSVYEGVGTREFCARIISGITLKDILVNVVYEDRDAGSK